MPKYLFFIYFLSVFLFGFERHKAPNFFKTGEKCHWYSPFKNITPETQVDKLKRAFLCGKKKGIKRKTLKAYKKLNLYHLFTPSGIHYGCLLLMLYPFFSLVNKKYPLISISTKSLIFLAPWLLNDFFSLKRIGAMKFLKLLPVFKEFNFIHIFFFYFALDFFFGTRPHSPMSFAFSFLFIGVIATSSQESFLKLSLYLFIGQMIYASIFFTKINPLSFIFSFSLTALFSPLFMLITLENFLPKIYLFESLVNFLVDHYNELVIISFKVIYPFGEMIPSLLLCLSLFLFLNKRKKLGILFLSLHSPGVLNLSSSHYRQGLYIYQTNYFINKKSVKKSYIRRGQLYLHFFNGRICRLKMYQYGNTKICRFKN